mgnify:FL=1
MRTCSICNTQPMLIETADKYLVRCSDEEWEYHNPVEVPVSVKGCLEVGNLWNRANAHK